MFLLWEVFIKGTFLLLKNQKKCNKTIVSIFINPTQFNNKNDFKKYPRNIKRFKILKKLKLIIYITKVKIFILQKKIKIKLIKKIKFYVQNLEKVILKVLLMLWIDLQIIKPKKIFMGEKDFQQLYLVKNLLKKNIILK